jgi:hypothetical protein
MDEKLFRTVSITESPETAAKVLSLLSKARMQENALLALWEAHFIDRQIRDALQAIFAEPDSVLVGAVRKQTELSLHDVRVGLGRVRAQFSFPTVDLEQLGMSAESADIPPNKVHKPAIENEAILTIVRNQTEPLCASFIREQLELDSDDGNRLSTKLGRMVDEGLLTRQGARRGTRYSLPVNDSLGSSGAMEATS